MNWPRQHESVLIQPGKQTHVVINPILYYTTDDAVKSLRTTDRQCYEDKEVLEGLSTLQSND